jgi:lipopolysaccharide export system protein LptA
MCSDVGEFHVKFERILFACCFQKKKSMFSCKKKEKKRVVLKKNRPPLPQHSQSTIIGGNVAYIHTNGTNILEVMMMVVRKGLNHRNKLTSSM